jgi:hypothetical protein
MLVSGVLFLKPCEAVEMVGGEAAAAVLWVRQGGGGHCLRAVGPWFRSGNLWWAPRGFDFFACC